MQKRSMFSLARFRPSANLLLFSTAAHSATVEQVAVQHAWEIKVRVHNASLPWARKCPAQSVGADR